MFSDSRTTVLQIGAWDMSNAVNLKSMFAWSHFNTDISQWDTSSCTSLRELMRSNPYFDQDLTGWDTSQVNNMNAAFEAASSYQVGDIGG